ncbi:MAG: polymorphic toxin-type HINT domain-containing protein [Phycisphaeraceae bacterium]
MTAAQGNQQTMLQMDAQRRRTPGASVPGPGLRLAGTRRRPVEAAKEEAADRLQDTLNKLSLLIGFVPIVGTLASAALDLLNASISLARGNYEEAALYALFALPLIGDAAQGMRLGQAFIKRASTGRGVAGLAAQGAAEGAVQLSIYHGVDWLAGGGANSFAAGTGVVTGVDATGEPVTTPIQHLQVGDVVLANDELNPDGEPHYALVTAVSHRTVYEHHTLTYIDAAGNSETLQTTADHGFYALAPDGSAHWRPAQALQAGDRLLQPDGTLATVTANTTTATPQGLEVYNLTVRDGATYYVDDGQGNAAAVWVHNARVRLWKAYEDKIRNQYRSQGYKLLSRQFTGKISGVAFKGVADAVTKVGNLRVAIEAKHIRKWESSIYNPSSKVGSKSFALQVRNKMLDQAKRYSNSFTETIYHTNDKDFAEYFQSLLNTNGISNIKIVISV